MPRKFAQAGKSDGRRKTNATETITVAQAWKRHIAVMTSAVRYDGTSVEEETEERGSVGEVARGK